MLFRAPIYVSLSVIIWCVYFLLASIVLLSVYLFLLLSSFFIILWSIFVLPGTPLIFVGTLVGFLSFCVLLSVSLRVCICVYFLSVLSYGGYSDKSVILRWGYFCPWVSKFCSY